MARQPNHHHHHHHVSSTTTSSATPARLFDLPNGYVGYGSGGHGASSSYGSYLLPFASSSSSHVRPTTTQLLPLPLPPAAITPLRLTGREDSTRVRLQKQRVGHQYRRSIVGDRIPGFKTSAGESFFPLFFSLQSFFSGNCNCYIDQVKWRLIDQTDVQASNAIDHCSYYPTEIHDTTPMHNEHHKKLQCNQANQTPSHQQPSSPPSEQTSASPPPHPQAQSQPHPA
jgi:hypothetical protein